MNKEFAAGLVVGEGCFYLGVQRIKARKGNLRITPGFRLFMNDHETIDLLIDFLKSNDLPVYVQMRKDGGKGVHATGLMRMKKYCEFFYPELTGSKKRACGLVLDFVNGRYRQKSGVPYSALELEIVKELRKTNGNHNGRKTPL